MRCSETAKLAMLIGFGLLATPNMAQQKAAQTWTVYVAALQGECRGGISTGHINGRPFATIARQRPGQPPEDEQTFLARFAADAAARKEVERELGKQSSVRVVNTPAEADFVLCFCSQYYYSKLPVRSSLSDYTGHRMFTEARAVGVQSWLDSPMDLRPLAKASFWHDDMLIDFPGDRITFDYLPPKVTLADLVKRFGKKLPLLAADIAALPKPQKPAANQSASRPGLVIGAAAETSKKPAQLAESSTSEPSALRVDTTLVIVPVMALDRAGKYLPGLRAEDFQVYEDGVRQEIADFGSSEKPFHVALVLDVSSSTKYKLEEIQAAALSFVEQLQPQDQVLVVSFERYVRVASEFTNQRAQLKKAISQTRPSEGTSLWDALDLVLTERLSKVEGRKAIIVFTDGVDTTSRLANLQQVAARVQEAGVILYPVCYDTLEDQQKLADELARSMGNGTRAALVGDPRHKREYKLAATQLKTLADISGGRYYQVTLAEAKRAFASIAEELRRYYWLGYYPANDKRDGAYRKIRVQAGRPDAVIRARAGYRSTTDAAVPPSVPPSGNADANRPKP